MGRERFDFLVLGAGHAGLAFAITAVQRGARVAVVSRDNLRAGVGEIVEAAVQAPLDALGLWPSFLAQGHLRGTGTLSRWTESEPQSRSAMVNPFGGGWFIDRTVFDAMLRQRAQGLGVQFATTRRTPDLSRSGISLEANGGPIEAALAIEATGRHGHAIAPPERQIQDDLVALLAYVEDRDCDLQFRLEAVDEGWWYSAPLPNGRRVLSLMTLIRHLPSGRAARLAFWRQSLAQCGLIVSPPAALALPRTCPSAGGIRQVLRGERWLAVGDAAAAYDPLHGLGIVAALTKGITAARLLTSASPIDCALRAYEDTERSTFAAYDNARRRMYRAAAVSRPTAGFWREVAA